MSALCRHGSLARKCQTCSEIEEAIDFAYTNLASDDDDWTTEQLIAEFHAMQEKLWGRGEWEERQK